MSVQSVLLDKSHFSLSEANNWIKRNGYKIKFGNKSVHETKNKYRYRQLAPLPGVRYRIKKISPGIEFVMEYKGEKK